MFLSTVPKLHLKRIQGQPVDFFAFHGYGPVNEIQYSSGPSVTTTTVSGKSSVQLVGHV